MKPNPKIFRLYDIRGIYPYDLNERIAYQIGRCFILFLKKKTKKRKLKIAIGKDVRPSSPILFKWFFKGVLDEGCDVFDLGLITTPMLYFAVSRFNFDGGVIITASHNPNPWNGLKLVQQKAIPLSGLRGIFWIRDFLMKKSLLKEKRNFPKGKIFKKNIEKNYLDFVLKLAKVKKREFINFSIAVDTGNGIAGPITLKILKKIGVKIHPLYCKPDGFFPHHVPNPLLKENLADLIKLIKKRKPNFGIALDGDGDRIIFIDENGKSISGDLITALMTRILLKEKKKIKILYDVRSSNIVRETILSKGGIPVLSRIGHAMIKEKMRKEKIFFGGEFSGHYSLGSNLFFEVPYFVLLKILKEIKENKTSLSQLIKPFKKYYHTDEINFEIEDKEKIIRKLKKKYKAGKILEIDGLKVDFKNWWFLIRPSQTEPVLRLGVEANNSDLLKKKKKELIKTIKAIAATKIPPLA